MTGTEPTHPFRFSTGYGGARSARQLTDWARRIEDLGYSTMTISDHFDDQLGPIATLTTAAAATRHLRVAPLVFCNDYRHPAVLAKEAATLDLLSDGRLELGIGAGWMTADYGAAGLVLDPPMRRIERLEESIDVIEGLWSGAAIDHHGTEYDITGLAGTPTPRRRPRWIIGGGGRAMLGLAARRADIVGLNLRLSDGRFDRAGATCTAAATDERISWIRTAAGARIDHPELQTRVHHGIVTDGRRAGFAAVADAFGISDDEATGTPHALVGTTEQIIEDLRARRERWGISYVAVNADMAEALAPVVAALTGT